MTVRLNTLTDISSPSVRDKSPLFTRFSAVFIVITVMLGFFASQLLGLYGAAKAVLPAADTMSTSELMLEGGEQGLVVSVSVLLSGALLVAMTFLIIRLKASGLRQVMDYLGIRHFGLSNLWIGLGLLAVFTVINEVVTAMLDRTPMAFVDPLFASTDVKWLLITVIVVVAPLYEELVFRGLLWSVIAEQFTRPKGIVIASLISSVLFAAVHLQYGLYEMAAIVVLASIFCYMRLRSKSLLLPIVLHMINNAVAMMLYLWLGSGA